MEETWKDIPNMDNMEFSKYYQVSNLGNIRSKDRVIQTKKGARKVKGKLLSPSINHTSYPHVNLRVDGKQKSYDVHRLVALAFVPNPYNLPMVNHKDENKLNNCAYNLEWCNSSYNSTYNGIHKRIAQTKGKPVDMYSSTGKLINRFESARQAERITGLSNANINKSCLGKYNATKGYKWRFTNMEYVDTLPNTDLEIYSVPNNDPRLKDLCLNHHYLHRMPSTKYCYALKHKGEDTKFEGMVVYGTIQFKTQLQNICNNGVSTRENTLELKRSYVSDDVRKTYDNVMSMFISRTLRHLKTINNFIIVSYADTGIDKYGNSFAGYSHFGYIYQASNFMYLGSRVGTFKRYAGYGSQSGTNWKKGVYYRFSNYPTIKELYIYIAGNKRFKKHVIQNLKYKPKAYPKGYERTYDENAYSLDRLIFDRTLGKWYLESDFVNTPLYKKYFVDNKGYIEGEQKPEHIFTPNSLI